MVVWAQCQQSLPNNQQKTEITHRRYHGWWRKKSERTNPGCNAYTDTGADGPDNISNWIWHQLKLEVLREHRPPPNASIIELLNDFCRASVLCVLTKWQFFPDPDRDPEWCGSSPKCNQLVSSPALHKISSKSVGNSITQWIGISYFELLDPDDDLDYHQNWTQLNWKLNSLVPVLRTTPPRNFIKIRSQLFLLFNRQTNRRK